MKRMALALGVNDVEEIAREIEKLIRIKPPKSLRDKLSLLGELIRLAGIPPKIVKDAACQETILREPDLGILPVLTCWPGDAGPFITLPMVFTKDPAPVRATSAFIACRSSTAATGMHWHLHKVGARHFLHQRSAPEGWNWRSAWVATR